MRRSLQPHPAKLHILCLGLVVFGGLGSFMYNTNITLSVDNDFVLPPTKENSTEQMTSASKVPNSVYDYLKECIPCNASNKHELEQYLPKLIIPGTQKSGTTFISQILGQHPAASAYRHETHILNNKTFARDGTVHQCEVWEEYKAVHSQCSGCQGKPFLVDKSVTYLFMSHFVPSRLPCVFPKPMKMLVLLRDPTARAYSDYQMHMRLEREAFTGAPGNFFDIVIHEKEVLDAAGVSPRLNQENGFLVWKQYFVERSRRHNNAVATNDPSFTSLLDRIFTSLLSRGLYALQLTHWIDILSDLWGLSHKELVENYFLILDNDDIKANMKANTEQILRFAGLPPHQYDTEQFEESGQIHTYTPLTDQEQKFLDDYYRPYNIDLHNLLQPYGIEIGFAKRAFEESQRQQQA